MGPLTGSNREAVFQFIKKLPHCTKILYLLLLLPWAHISLSLTERARASKREGERQTKPNATLLPYVQCTKWTAHVFTAASPSPRQTCLTSSSDMINKYFDNSRHTSAVSSSIRFGSVTTSCCASLCVPPGERSYSKVFCQLHINSNQPRHTWLYGGMRTLVVVVVGVDDERREIDGAMEQSLAAVKEQLE